ncbi:MAG: S8 family serine peptidase [Acidobacteriota bacterium]
MKKLAHVLVLALVVVATSVPVVAADKIKVESVDDLPRFTYEIDGTLAELLESDSEFAEFSARVRADVESVLAAYEINDATTLKNYYGTLLSLQMLDGQYDQAEATIQTLRDLEDKPAAKLLTGQLTGAWIDTKRKIPDSDSDAFRAAFQSAYSSRLESLPFDVVQDNVEQAKGGWEIRSQNLLLGVLESQLQPAVDKTGTISGEVADTLVSFRLLFEDLLPLKSQAIAALGSYIDANRTEKPDIWAERSVELEATAEATPVVVAIWDSGVDTNIFEGRLFVNPAERFDGEDTDGNGYVDDVNGIAYTLEADKTPDLLYPLDDETKPRYEEMKSMVKGLMDIQAAVDSPEASNLKQQLSQMPPEEVQPFIEDISLFGNFAHGTHVAGIAVEGNPFARILAARITFDHHMIPPPPTVEQAKKDVAAMADVIDYFKANQVRIVNMSWGESQPSIEQALELNGMGESAQDRLAMAQEIFAVIHDGLRDAIAGAPEILFVTSAGNSDNDAEFDLMIPSSYDLPNILTVGAVDQAGEETSFSTFGANVDLHANGFEVVSYVPGGDRMAFSGTSMSSPNVVNLAAKILAIDPDLTPSQLIEVIKEGTETSADGRITLINPKATFEGLQHQGP